MTAHAVRDDQHGTPTGYQYGCRCDACRAASSRYAGHIPVTECITVHDNGKTSHCAEIAGNLVRADRNLQRVARLANRSKSRYEKYADELAQARETRARARTERDEHMAECPGALDRFGAA